MYRENIVNGQSNHFYLNVDVRHSSDPRASIDIRKKKITNLYEWIVKYFDKEKISPDYQNFTGDGMLMAFKEYDQPMELSIWLLKKTCEFNATIEDKNSELHLKIGIGYGTDETMFMADGKPLAPWGDEMITTVRITEAANSDQILLTRSAYKNIGSKERRKVIAGVANKLWGKWNIGSKERRKGKLYREYLEAVGNVHIKHESELEPVYAFYSIDEADKFGTNEKVVNSPDFIKLIEETAKLPETKNALGRFASFMLENQCKDFLETLENRAIECTLEEADEFYRHLFANATNYSGSTYMLPSMFYDLRHNFIQFHDGMRKDRSSPELYRFVICGIDELVKDYRLHKASFEAFMNSHEKRGVRLFQVEPSEAQKHVHGEFMHSLDVALWKGKYAIHSDGSPDSLLFEKRRLFFSEVGGTVYDRCERYINGLINITDEGKTLKITSKNMDQLVKEQ